MKRTLLLFCVALAAPCFAQLSKVQFGNCTSTLGPGAAPYAVAQKLGWFKEEGIDFHLVLLNGSGDCVKNVVTREIPFAAPSVEPLATAHIQGAGAKIFYNMFQRSIREMAVPVDSPIHAITDLKGKTIGVASMGVANVWVGKGMVAAAGMDPERDVRFAVVGWAAQAAALVRTKQVDALSMDDTTLAAVESAGIKLRRLDTRQFERYPCNGFSALEETLRTRRRDAVGVARAYAKGTIFAINNPEAAVRVFYEVYPETKPTGKDDATIIREGIDILQRRIPKLSLEHGGVKRWGELPQSNYAAYLDLLSKWRVIPQKVDVHDVVTNELIDEINRFDPAKIAAQAKAYKPHS